MTEAEILRCIEAVDKRKQQGESADLAPSGAKLTQDKPIASSEAPGKSAEKTAKVAGVSQRKVERARAVLSDPEEKEAVLAGKKSIHKASRAVKEKRLKVVPYEPVVSEQDKRQETLLKAWEEIRACQAGQLLNSMILSPKCNKASRSELMIAFTIWGIGHGVGFSG